ncbi:protein shisa-5-like isoform X1 [Seriola lalandi dorsalis]|uniref:Protein shisa-5 n=1 Tax=Seriola lalandi dorsalis TaxID=1841481 RepID=A0A3B4WJE3_SERLL|nr:protein shisa-5-like isoform X1 [Seriola lalandi dorsalis]
MASGLCSVVVLVLCVALAPSVSAEDNYCKSYTDITNTYISSQYCFPRYCCGSCQNRYCCERKYLELTEDEQDDCTFSSTYHHINPLPIVLSISFLVVIVLIFICCCVCPCCCLYKACCKPRPVVATTTHTTVVTTSPQPYPQQSTSMPSQPHSYQGAQYSPYQPIPMQPGYGTQPMPQGYGAQPMPTMPYSGQLFTPGPPPTYQEATGPAYPPKQMPYSQAAFSPGQPAYPIQPPVQPQPNAPPAHTDYHNQPAFNPDYVAP